MGLHRWLMCFGQRLRGSRPRRKIGADTLKPRRALGKTWEQAPTAFEAAQLIKPPALRGVSDFQTFPQSALSSFLKPCRAYRKRILWSLLAKSLFRMPRPKGRRPLYLQDTYPRKWLPKPGYPSPTPSPVPIPRRRKTYSPHDYAG